MPKLRNLYWGPQDEHFCNSKINPTTFVSEYLDTIKSVVSWNKTVPYNPVPKEVWERYDEIMKQLNDSPLEYAETYVERKKEYIQKGYWDFLTNGVRPSEPSNNVRIKFDGMKRNDIGFTGLHFVGNPSDIEKIEFMIGGNHVDAIYPSITGQFDSIQIFDAVIPNPIWHELWITVFFCKANQPLEVIYDRVTIKGDPDELAIKGYDAFHLNTQFYGGIPVKKGPSNINLTCINPIERITFLATKPLSNTVLVLSAVYKLHVPYKGMQGDKHMYEVAFNTSINFSRIDSTYFQFEASEETIIYPFMKTYHICRFMNGMAGNAYAH